MPLMSSVTRPLSPLFLGFRLVWGLLSLCPLPLAQGEEKTP